MRHHLGFEETKFHLLAVSVAADLAQVKSQGEAISLEALNAKVLVSKAGIKALGFQPITDFMVQLSKETINLVVQIEKKALAVSHEAVGRLRTVNSVQMAQRAQKLAANNDARYGAQIEIFVKATIAQDQDTISRLLEHAEQLVVLLKQIVARMKSANAVSYSVRIEAATVDANYSDAFRSVANKLEDCSRVVSEKVNVNLRLLNKALKLQEE